MTATTFYLVSVFVLATVHANALDACYWPTGERDDHNSWACNKTAYANGDGSACCSAGDTCMGSGVCYQGWSGIMYRQTCTDREWKSSSCSQVAAAGAFNVSEGVWILQCDISTKSWCTIGPGVEGPCCNNETKGVTWSDWVPGYTTGLISDTKNNKGENLLDDSASTSTGATLSPTSSTINYSSGKSSAPSSAETSPITTLSSIAETSQKSHPYLGVGLGVGIGVGVPICLLAAILLFWTRRERTKRLIAEKQLHGMFAKSSDTPLTSPPQEAKLQPFDPISGGIRPHEVSDEYRRNELWAGPTINELGGNEGK